MSGERAIVVRSNGELSSLPVTFSRVGVEFIDELSYEQWEQGLDYLGRADSGLMWWIGDWLNYGERKYDPSLYKKAEDEIGLATRTIEDAKYVAGRVKFTLRNVKLTFTHHKCIAPLNDPRDQKRWLARAEKEEWSAAQLRQAIREYNLLEAAKVHPLPPGKFRILYADPPWKYDDELIEGYGAAEHHYPTMTAEELAAIPVAGLVAEDAVIFLWATVPLLPDALHIVEAWGFEYKTLFVWDKVKHNYGHYNSVRAELLLLCTRGSCLPDSGELVDSVVTLERTDKHSEKPEEFRQLIDSLYTHGSRIELFARKRVEGWEAWGNEV